VAESDNGGVVGSVDRQTLTPHRAVPEFPGAMNKRSQRGLAAIFQASAVFRARPSR
jgi:hypothetical protein